VLLHTGRDPLGSSQVNRHRLLDEERQLALHHQVLRRAVSEGRQHYINCIWLRLLEHLLRVGIDLALTPRLGPPGLCRLRVEVAPAHKPNVGKVLETLL